MLPVTLEPQPLLSPVFVPAQPPVMELPLPAEGRGVACPARTGKVLIAEHRAEQAEPLVAHLYSCGYEPVAAQGPDVLEAIVDCQPDVVLLNADVPQLGGLELLRRIRVDAQLNHLPVLLLFTESNAALKRRGYELGATDFLTRPVDETGLVMRVRNAMTTKSQSAWFKQYSQELERQVRLRTAELQVSREHVIHCLARAAEFRDEQTGHHVVRVGLYAGLIGRELGFDEEWVTLLEDAAQLHDVGKIGIADTILLKPGPLTRDEFEQMKLHCAYGRRIILPKVEELAPEGCDDVDALVKALHQSPIMEMAAVIAETHHEKWDGSGYPNGLAGETIPIEGRITAVADVYDALSNARPYKPAFPPEKCFKILRKGRGKHFDPRVVDAFLARKEDILKIQSQNLDIGQARLLARARASKTSAGNI